MAEFEEYLKGEEEMYCKEIEKTVDSHVLVAFFAT